MQHKYGKLKKKTKCKPNVVQKIMYDITYNKFYWESND